MDLDAERLTQILRYDGEDWHFSCELREGGDWATLSVPIRSGIPDAQALHALALVAVTIDAAGLVNAGTMVFGEDGVVEK